MPNLLDPISASPDSLSRMRRYFTPGASGSLLGFALRRSTPAPFGAAPGRLTVAVLPLALGHGRVVSVAA